MPIMRLTEADRINLGKVKQLIETDYKTHYSTEYLANVALMSRSKLTKAYRIYFGMALFEHLKHYRLLLAKGLLEQNKLAIKVIASQCGYHHQGNFTTAFKKRYGMSPKEYREL